MKTIHYFLIGTLWLLAGPGSAQQKTFNYKRIISGGPFSLTATAEAINGQTGDVTINGGDSRQPTTPFTFIWGDESTSSGFFPAQHKYADKQKNYLARVVGHYQDGSHDTVDVQVDFLGYRITQGAIDPVSTVTIPAGPVQLTGRAGITPPANLTFFSDEMFTGKWSRADLAYVLSVLSGIEYDFTNGDVYLNDNKFQQLVLRDPSAGGGYSLWFTNPVSLAAGDGLIRGNADVSSLAHEMGHNYTLNTPSKYYFGGKSDGLANAIYSETMAQIYAHAAGYELINAYDKFGLDESVRHAMIQNFWNSFRVLKGFYQQYLDGGKKFTSWNDPSTAIDETLPSFGTTAYKFCEIAESENKGFREPLKRMMLFLQRFNAEWHSRYQPSSNTSSGNAFRATMMVAAISHAFSKDLRAMFRELNYPVSDADWAFLNPVVSTGSSTNWLDGAEVFKNLPFPNPTSGLVNLPGVSRGRAVEVLSIDGTVIQILQPRGLANTVDLGSFPAGLYLLRSAQNGVSKVVKVVKMDGLGHR